MSYSSEQIMLSLSFVSYLGFDETRFGTQAQRRTYRSIAEGLEGSPCIAGQWEIVWGPAMYRLPLTIFDENLMFVARAKQEPWRYAIVVRGTNPLSITNWLLQDFNVVRQTPWPYNRRTPNLEPKLSQGTARGLQALQHVTPGEGIPGDGKSLYQFLVDEVAQARTEERLLVAVTGHSLGGALSPAVALWLADTQQTSDDPAAPPWDPKLKCSFEVFAFAGPSPGNADFATYYDQRLGACTRRIWNSLDIVPHGWVVEALARLPGLYRPHITPDLLMSLVLWTARALAQNGDYQHISARAAPLKGAALKPILKDYAAQMLYQHTAAYPELFKLDHEIDSTLHFLFDDVVGQAVHAAHLDALLKNEASGTVPLKPAGLPGHKRGLARRASELAHGLHNLYRVPATIVMTALPEALALAKLLKRSEHFHARCQAKAFSRASGATTGQASRVN